MVSDWSRGEGSWFAAFPDTDASSTAAGLVARIAPQVAHHPSGRPWLMGRWNADSPGVSGFCAMAAGRHLQVAIFGAGPEVVAVLPKLVGEATDHSAVATALAASPGCTHVVSRSSDGDVRLQGTLAGVKRLFIASIGGVVIASDRADILGGLKGHHIDERHLSTRLLAPHVPHPFNWLPMWTGVGAIEPDSVVRLERDGTSSLVSRRQLPTAHSSRAAAVDSVRLSLANGVASRVSAAGREGLALDLSGGLDSTSLCFLAQAAGAAAFTTVTHVDPGVGNDDEVWAARASRELAGASRLLLGEAETGTQFASAAASGFECDEPLWELRTYGIFGRLAEVLKEHGVLIHIAGFGGDEVFRTPAIYLYGLIRRRPVLGVSHLRGMRAIARWRWPGIAQGLTDRRSYDRWLLGEAPSLSPDPPSGIE